MEHRGGKKQRVHYMATIRHSTVSEDDAVSARCVQADLVEMVIACLRASFQIILLPPQAARNAHTRMFPR